MAANYHKRDPKLLGHCVALETVALAGAILGTVLGAYVYSRVIYLSVFYAFFAYVCACGRWFYNSERPLNAHALYQASLDKRLSDFDESAKQLRQRRGDMEKTAKKAALDRAELRKELDELRGRSTGDAQRATEVWSRQSVTTNCITL